MAFATAIRRSTKVAKPNHYYKGSMKNYWSNRKKREAHCQLEAKRKIEGLASGELPTNTARSNEQMHFRLC
jgi:phage replication-related protein YjqB (UPF0714/DUF867 family)